MCCKHDVQWKWDNSQFPPRRNSRGCKSCLDTLATLSLHYVALQLSNRWRISVRTASLRLNVTAHCIDVTTQAWQLLIQIGQINTTAVIIPLLHFTVGLTRVVDQPTDVAHAIAIDDDTAVQMHAVVVTFIRILLRHTTSELLLAHHLTDVLCYKLTYTTSTDAAICCINHKLCPDV